VKVLVSGATGYLGAALVRMFLQEPEVQVIALGRSTERLRMLAERFPDGRERLDPWNADLLELPALREPVDLVVHAAAIRPPTAGDSEAFRRVNVGGTEALALAAAAAGCSRFVYASTQAVYGLAGAPWAESAPPAPQTPYGATKLEGERVAAGFSDAFEVVCLRLSRLYGVTPEMRWEELPGRFAERAVRGEPIPVYGTGEQRFDLLHIDDAVSGFLAAARADISTRDRVLNLGGGRSVTVMEIAETILQSAEARGVSSGGIRRLPEHATGEVSHLELSIDSARRELGWTPSVSLRLGLDGYVEGAIRRLRM